MFLQLFRVVYVARFIQNFFFIPTTGGSADLDAEVYRSIQNTLVYYNECIPTSRACAETDNKSIEMASLLTHFEMQSVTILNGTL